MSKETYYIEGDFIEDINGVIFDVKGFEHPPGKVVAFPRYVPNPEGDRGRNNKKYSKIYGLSDRYKFLQNTLRRYLVYDDVFDTLMCEVPRDKIIKHYKPKEALKKLIYNFDRLSEIERKALKMVLLIIYESGLTLNDIGISGSIMVGLHKKDSDIDIVVYGTKKSYDAIIALKNLFLKNVLKKYDIKGYKRLYKFRKAYKTMDFEVFMRHEERKLFQGIFEDKEFFIRFVKNPKEIHPYGYYKYKNVGYVRIKARIIDDSESIFTPVKYFIDNITILQADLLENIDTSKISEIVSFRGRFCQQAFKNENIIVQGKLEKMIRNGKISHYRVLIGGSDRDFMVSEGLMK